MNWHCLGSIVTIYGMDRTWLWALFVVPTFFLFQCTFDSSGVPIDSGKVQKDLSVDASVDLAFDMFGKESIADLAGDINLEQNDTGIVPDSSYPDAHPTDTAQDAKP
ncbi:MAG: hypothetical protein V1754_13745 [Pseudomonadota bacterium]